MGKERETRFNLTSGRRRRQPPADPTSQRQQHFFPSLSETATTLTSDGHETPPESPATELDTNSTPDAPDHSSIQQTPADETPPVPESAVLVICHSFDEHYISPNRFLLNSSPSSPRQSH